MNIAFYGFTQPHEERLWKAKACVKAAKALINNLEALIQTRHQYERRLKESKGLVDKKELAITKNTVRQC